MTEVEQTQREKILQRILNLRAKAENAGSSEAEMNNAFTIAMKLMDSYNVEEAELAVAENTGRIVLDIVQKNAEASALLNKVRHKIVLCVGAIAEFTSTKCVYNSYSGKITYTGHRPDTELADYLTSVVRHALDAEYQLYWDRTPRVGRGAKVSFQINMACRISSRLYAMKREQEAEQTREYAKAKLQIESNEIASSTAIVIKALADQKREAVNASHAKAYPSLRSASSFSYGSNTSAHRAGAAAGDRINLGRAIASGSTKMIGK